MSETQNEVAELTKRPMIVKQVDNGPIPWVAMKFMSDGYIHAAPGGTEREAIENLSTVLMKTLEEYEKTLKNISDGKGQAQLLATAVLGSRFRNG